MTQLNDLKRACQEKLAHKKGDLYGREQLRADMDYSFAATPDKILALISSHEQLQSKLDKACEALEFYAGTKDGKWVDHVCDSYSGLNYAFDWNGDTQDEPHEVAVKAIAEIRKKDDNG